MDFTLKVQLIHKDAKLPFRANPGDAGLDLYAVEEQVIKAGESALIPTGIVIELPKGTEAQVRPRSGLALKHSITVLNSPGTVDEGYRGEIRVILINHGKKDFLVEKHMRIAQIVIAPVLQVNVEQVDAVSDSVRSVEGFGSSGKF